MATPSPALPHPSVGHLTSASMTPWSPHAPTYCASSPKPPYEDAVPKWAVEGSLVKREQCEQEGVNLGTGVMEKTLRVRVRVEDRGVRVFSEEGVELIVGKYWT